MPRATFGALAGSIDAAGATFRTLTGSIECPPATFYVLASSIDAHRTTFCALAGSIDALAATLGIFVVSIDVLQPTFLVWLASILFCWHLSFTLLGCICMLQTKAATMRIAKRIAYRLSATIILHHSCLHLSLVPQNYYIYSANINLRIS